MIKIFKLLNLSTKKQLLIFLFSISLITVLSFTIFSPAFAGTDGSNNSPETAQEISDGEQISTGIDYEGDEDWFKISVDDTCSIVSTITNNTGSIYYKLYDDSLNYLDYEYISSSETDTHSWKVNPGVYYIKLYESIISNYQDSEITLEVNLREEDQWENNDASDIAVEITPGQELTGIAIEAQNDSEWFKVTVDRTCSLVSTITFSGVEDNRTYAWVCYDIYNSNMNNLYNNDVTNDRTETFSWKVSPGTYYIRLKEKYDNSIDYFNNNITFNFDICEEDPWENNDTSVQATELFAGQELEGMVIEAHNDKEWFKVTVDRTCSLVSTVTFSGVGDNRTYAYVYYDIYDSNMNNLYNNDVTNDRTETFSWKVSPGTYYIRLKEKYDNSIDYFNNNITFNFDICEEDPWENNDTSVQATELFAGQELEGMVIEAYNDKDWFKITVDHNCSFLNTLTFTTTSNYPYQYVNYYIYDQYFNNIYNTYIYNNKTKTYSFDISPGTYYIRLSARQLDNIDYLNSYLNMVVTTTDDAEFIQTLRTTFGQQPGDPHCGDPVNVITGNYTLEETDFKIPTRSVPLEFTRSYNSRDTYTGSLGKGWQHNYNSFLTINTDDDTVSVYYPDGHSSVFTLTDGSYVPMTGCYEALNENSDDTYSLKFKDQTVYEYDTQGKLTQIVDKNGNTTNLSYTDSLLTTVTEPAGRTLQFTYNSDNLLTRVTDPAGRNIDFTYDQDSNLATVTDVNGGITTYEYVTYGLSTITDPNGNTIISNSYDSNSRVIEQEDAKGNITEYTYDSVNKKNTVVDPRGFAAEFHYDENLKVTKIVYPEDITDEYAYDENYNRISETDKNGNTKTYTYDDMGNMLTKTYPAPLGYSTIYVYDSLNNPVQITDAAGYITDYTYDDNANLLTVSKEVYGTTATTSFDYDQCGQVIGITNPNGNTTLVDCDEYGNRTSVTDPLGNTTTYTYDTIGRKLTEISPQGNEPGANPQSYQSSYTYDQVGNLLTITDPLGNVITNTYDANNNLTSTTDSKGNTITLTYDKNNNLVTETDLLGNTTTYQYDTNNNLSTKTDANDNSIRYDYDFLERLVSTTYPDGSNETLTLDGNGNVITKTDPKGNIANYQYDELNRLNKITDTQGGTITTQYDPLGNKTSITDQRGNTTTYTYDEASQLLNVTDPLDLTTSYTYDLAGNKLTETNPQGVTWINSYDDASRLVKTTDPLGNESVVEYDSAGNVITSTNANNASTIFTYDALNKLETVTDALGNTTKYTYDENDNLTGVTNANGQTTTYSYDDLNRPVAQTNPLGQTQKTSYDPVGNLVTKTKPDGTNIDYTYDTNNRLTKITYPDHSQVSYEYDKNGNRTLMNDFHGTTSYSYDSESRLTSVTQSVYSIDYDYDSVGNITGITYPDELQVSYAYNELNQPVSVTDAVYATAIFYDKLGNATREELPNGVNVSYQYDDIGRLTSLEHSKGETVLAGFEYSLDNLGNRLSVTDANGQTTNYTYDVLNQLTKVQYPDSNSASYTYDPVGNRTSAGGTSYSYDNANRLIQVGSIPYSYDTNGNLTSVSDSVYYDYDYEDRLIQFTSGGDIYSYAYDGDGNRLNQSVTGSVYENHTYIYDINAGLPLLLVEKDSAGDTNNYLYAGRLFGRIGNEGQIYYHADGLGSVSVVSDVYGGILNQYEYDPFGNPLSASETVDNIFRFTGEPYDSSGLIFLRARYYDPAIGRFLTQDTLMGELDDPLSQNLYVYCGNNPVVYIDPSGHVPKVCFGKYTPKHYYQAFWDYAPVIATETASKIYNYGYNEAKFAFDLWMEYPGPGGGGAVSAAGTVISKGIKGGLAKGTGNVITKGSLDSLPQNTQNMYSKYGSNSWKGNVSGQTPGTAAGSTFRNRDGILPSVDNVGNSITYKEFDINNKLPNQGRDAERFVRGSDGSVYYTNDHYKTFVKID